MFNNVYIDYIMIKKSKGIINTKFKIMITLEGVRIEWNGKEVHEGLFGICVISYFLSCGAGNQVVTWLLFSTLYWIIQLIKCLEMYTFHNKSFKLKENRKIIH